MLIIGITGGIGSGKTAASDYFAGLDIRVIDADVVAREVVEPNQPAWHAIKARYGADALLEDGSLNRTWLREKVFAEPEERHWLESQTHPRIREAIITQLSNAKSAYVILVSPLLFESKQNELVDRTLVIDVDEQTQIERACSRDNNDQEQIKRIIAAQIPRQERLALADDIADNNGELAQLFSQLDDLHQTYLAMAASV